MTISRDARLNPIPLGELAPALPSTGSRATTNGLRLLAFALVAVASGVIALGCRGGQDPQPGGDDPTGLISAGTQGSVPIVTTNAKFVESLERVIEQLVRTDEFSGVVLLSRHGQALLRGAYGLADRERQRVNTVDTPFALASVSKMFTAVVVAQLVEKDLISFDATIGSLLPAYPKGEASSKVTVHHLLTMSSGIPDLFRSPQFWADVGTMKEFADFWPHFAQAPLDFEPGTQGVYSIRTLSCWVPSSSVCSGAPSRRS